jgi:hypothetical protein
MTDTVTSQNIYLSYWDFLYVTKIHLICFLLYWLQNVDNKDFESAKLRKIYHHLHTLHYKPLLLPELFAGIKISNFAFDHWRVLVLSCFLFN